MSAPNRAHDDFIAYSDAFNARLLSGEATWDEISEYISAAEVALRDALAPIRAAQDEIMVIARRYGVA